MINSKSFLLSFLLFLLLTVATTIKAQDKIIGPWLWMCLKVDGAGGAAAVDQDTLKIKSNGQVTENRISKNGVQAGNKVGKLIWSRAKITTGGGNNINPIANILDFCDDDCDDMVAYAFIEIEAMTAGNRTMKVGSDDSIKVWLNGKVVHRNAINRGAVNFQDTFKVVVQKGKNLLLVKVGERGGGWSMFVGMTGKFTAAGKKYPRDGVDDDDQPVRAGIAGKKIIGPWLWMMAPCQNGQGGKASTNIDSLNLASKGKVTEKKIAKLGAVKGQKVGKLAWKESEISAQGGNNVNDVLNKVRLGKGDINDASAYAYINVISPSNRQGVGFVGSDDSVKVWLNGVVIHQNATNRGAGNFQDKFNISLKKGDNHLLVKVSERGGGWSMFIGFDTKTERGLKFSTRRGRVNLSADSRNKLVTKWSSIRI